MEDKRAVLFALDEFGIDSRPTADEFVGDGCGMAAMRLLRGVEDDYPDGALIVWMTPAAREEFGIQTLGFDI